MNVELEWLHKRAAEARESAERKQAETPRQLFLPGFDIGAMPNHLNRSSLIAPIARGPRKFHRQTPMVTRKDCVLEYTGEQLDEADGDLIMALIYFAQKQPLGTPVPLNRKELIRKIRPGSKIGGRQYSWLHERMRAVTEGTLYIEARKPDGSARYRIGRAVAFHIVARFEYDEVSETYTYTLDSRWVQLFGNREYALIDWDKRVQIERAQDMAKTLQRLIATSADTVQRYSLGWLKEKMLYTSPMRKFRVSLEGAARELERLAIIGCWRIECSTKGKPQLALWRCREPVA